MRRALRVLAVAVLLAVPAGLEAQVSIGPTVAFHDDFDFGIGAMVGAQLPALATGVGFLGDFTLFFPDNVDYWELNGNLTWDVPLPDAPVAPFFLGGLNLANFSSDIGDQSTTELGLNLGGGVRFNAGTLNPLVGLKAELDGGEGVVIFGALPFALGG